VRPSAADPDPYDGSGADPCSWDEGGTGYPASDNQDTCGDSVSFSNFAISSGAPAMSSKRASLEQSWMAAPKRASSVEEA
jgi:hypothetical protein